MNNNINKIFSNENLDYFINRSRIINHIGSCNNIFNQYITIVKTFLIDYLGEEKMQENLRVSILNNNNNEKISDLIRKIRISVSRLIRPKPTTIKKGKGWLALRVPIAGEMHQKQFIAV